MRQAKQPPVVRSRVAAAGDAKPFTWQHTGVRLLQAPWVQDTEQQQQVVTASVSVAEESSPQYALTFTATTTAQLQGPRDTRSPLAVRVVRKVTKQHMASAFERAVSGSINAQVNGFAQLRTRSIESSHSSRKPGPQRQNIDDAVCQWLLLGKAAPSREEIVLWLLSRMILVQGGEAEAWNLLICGEQGAEQPVAVVNPPLAKVKLSAKPSAQSKQGDREIGDSDGEDDEEEELPDYEERLVVRANEIDEGDEDEGDGEASDTPREFGEMDEGGGDEHAASEDLLNQDSSPLVVLHKSSRHRAWAEANVKSMSALESAKNNSSKLSASTATASSNNRTLGPENIDMTTSVHLQPELPTSTKDPMATEPRRQTKSQHTFEPASTRILHRSTSSTKSSSNFDVDLTNEWTQDRKSFQLELSKSRKDIQAAKQLQRKTEAIAHLRRQQLLTQSQRRLRAHDQKREDSRKVTQLVADTLEYHELLHSLETQVRRTRIAATREQEWLSQTVRVALGRDDRHVKGPILGTGPLSQREIDACTATRSNRDGHPEAVDTPFVYDLHGRRHAAEDAGDIVALGVFESAMLKIKRVLDNTSKKAGSRNNRSDHLLETFHKFDTNRSGTLSRDEFANVLLANGVKLTSEQAHVLFSHFDPNHSGEIDYGELLWGFFNRRAFLKKWQQKKTRLSEREVKLLFYQYDRTGRGALSVADFQLAMEHIGFQLTESELRLLVLKFDANQDGFIDYHEFHAFVNNGEGEDEQIEQGSGGNRDTKSQSYRDRDGKERRGSKSRSAAPVDQYQRPSVKGDSENSEKSVEQILYELRALSETQMKIRQSIRK